MTVLGGFLSVAGPARLRWVGGAAPRIVLPRTEGGFRPKKAATIVAARGLVSTRGLQKGRIGDGLSGWGNHGLGGGPLGGYRLPHYVFSRRRVPPDR